MKIEVTNGEIVDKLCDLKIKLDRTNDQMKLQQLEKQYYDLFPAFTLLGMTFQHPMAERLLDLNQKLWEIDSQMRQMEKDQVFNYEFIELARTAMRLKDRREDLKKLIDNETASLNLSNQPSTVSFER